MTDLFRKGAAKLGLALALAATATIAAAPAEARDRYGRHRGGDDAAIAIAAGIAGLAIGAAISDNGGRHYNDRYNRGGYYYPQYRGGYYNNGYEQYNGYYNNNYDQRYRNYDRRYRDYDRYDRYGRHERKHERWHDRHDRRGY